LKDGIIGRKEPLFRALSSGTACSEFLEKNPFAWRVLEAMVWDRRARGKFKPQ
jgi:hypothetical protein